MCEICDSVDPEVVLQILVHKFILASLSEGIREGRMLLHDWLVILTAQYNDLISRAVQYGNSTSSLPIHPPPKSAVNISQVLVMEKRCSSQKHHHQMIWW